MVLQNLMGIRLMSKYCDCTVLIDIEGIICGGLLSMKRTGQDRFYIMNELQCIHLMTSFIIKV